MSGAAGVYASQSSDFRLRCALLKTDRIAGDTEGKLMHSENLEAPWRFKYQVGQRHHFDGMANVLIGLLM